MKKKTTKRRKRGTETKILYAKVLIPTYMKISQIAGRRALGVAIDEIVLGKDACEEMT